MLGEAGMIVRDPSALHLLVFQVGPADALSPSCNPRQELAACTVPLLCICW